MKKKKEEKESNRKVRTKKYNKCFRLESEKKVLLNLKRNQQKQSNLKNRERKMNKPHCGTTSSDLVYI